MNIEPSVDYYENIVFIHLAIIKISQEYDVFALDGANK